MHAECAVKDNVAILMGEITTKAKVDYTKVVRDTAERIGYDGYLSKGKLNANYYIWLENVGTMQVLTATHAQC